MTSLLEIIFSFIGFGIILGYVLWQDNKLSKLERENRELRHKIQTK